jgi:phage shock protein A
MSLWNKIFTLFRGAATEAGQAVVDKNALRILDQEIRDASDALRKSRDDLTHMMASRRLAYDKLLPKAEKITEYTGFIEQLLARGDEALAREVAEKLATLETDCKQESQVVQQYDSNIETLKKSILQAESTISRLKQQVDSVKATANVQRAQAAIAARHSGTNSALRTAADSLERIKQQQAEHGARIEAAAQVEHLGADSDLKAKLASAGLLDDSSSASAVLARIKAKSQAALPAPNVMASLPPPNR